MENASVARRAGLLFTATVMVLTTFAILGPTPADATVTNSCGSLEHGGNTGLDYAWAYWNYTTDPDCIIKAMAKCGDTPTDPNAIWYSGPWRYFGSTSYKYCPGGNPELVTWGYGWSY